MRMAVPAMQSQRGLAVLTCPLIVLESRSTPPHDIESVGFPHLIAEHTRQGHAAQAVFHSFAVLALVFPRPCEIPVNISLFMNVVMAFGQSKGRMQVLD